VLEVSVPIAYELLAQCIKQGQALVQRASLVGDFSDYESWKSARKQWIDPTVQALEHMYGGSTQAREFAACATSPEGTKRWQEQYGGDLKCVKHAIDLLETLQGEPAFSNGSGPPAAAELAPLGAALAAGDAEPAVDADRPSYDGGNRADFAAEAIDVPIGEIETQRVDAAEHEAPAPPALGTRATEHEADEQEAVGAELAHAPQVGSQLAQHPQPAPPVEREPPDAPATARTRDVYLAHGRDEKWKQAVEHLLEQSGEHEIKIVNRRAKERAQLTEELREDAPGSHYAVVLLTADDVGGARLESDAEPYFSTRAHQEVVFEMGFLVAALTPGRVCVLYEDGVELPCDIDGVSHVRLDLAGTWQPKLLLHLRRAGFDYDMNRLVAV
jgi:predicted nucleotide-binding protein